MKNDLFEYKHLSFHYVGKTKTNNLWEFHILPFITVDYWRIFFGWLCFTIQWTYNISDDPDNDFTCYIE